MVTISSQVSVPSQIDIACKNVLCNNCKAFVLFGIDTEEDRHLVAVENIYTISLRKGLPTKRALKKAWKLRVPVEGKLWSSEAEVKDLIKECFKDFTLLNPPPISHSFSKK